MTKYLNYDEKTGNIKGFYAEDIHGNNIPKPNIEISDEKWQELLNDNCNFIVDTITKEIQAKEKDLEFEKINLLKTIKYNIKKELSELDWKSLRHLEQKNLNIIPSLSDENYKDLLLVKQNLREKIDRVEKEISDSRNLAELESIYSEFNCRQ